jgi:hypothetical protein
MVPPCYTENDELAGQTVKFDLDETVKLLLGQRKEEFRHERVIRLFQLQIWIWCPGDASLAENAGKLAASIILSDLEDQMFPHMGRLRMPMERFKVLSKSTEYRKLFDEVIAPGLGWSSIVGKAFRSENIDKRIADRSRYGQMIADLIDYRLRAVLNGRTKREANITRAVFFNWWPGRKKPSPRRRFDLWGQLQQTSAFIYLIEKQGYPMRPPKVNEDEFFYHLLHPPISKAKLRTFFSKYAFIIDKLQLPAPISITFNQTPIKVEPFSNAEEAVINDYPANREKMNEKRDDQMAADDDLNL